jgi:hypothetical protein
VKDSNEVCDYGGSGTCSAGQTCTNNCSACI